MTMYKRGFDASLARYNARKRELQASMLEYSEHMRQIHTHGGPRLGTSKESPESSLEVRARGHFFPRRSDPGFLTKRLRQERRARVRPSSLDEKELQLNAHGHKPPKRDTKSERALVTVPTALPPLVDPPNSPDLSRKSDVRVSFVSASDLYDIVDFGTSSQSPRKDSAKVANFRDSIKLIEDIETQNRRERNIAWEKQTNASGKEHSPSRASDLDILSGRRIHPQPSSLASKETNSNASGSPKSKYSQENRDKGKFVVTSNSKEILPLNVLLEQAAASHMKGQNKIRTRPKRAKRMQLHKSSLVVIPEDGGTFVYIGDDQSSSDQNSGRNSILSDVEFNSISSPSSSPISSKDSTVMHNLPILTSINARSKDNSPSRTNEQSVSGSQRQNNASSCDEKNRKPILKRSTQGGDKERGEGRQLAELLVTNSGYSSLPWEKDMDNQRDRGRHVSHDTSISKIKARRKLKRLVFLRDQPQQDM